MFAISLSRRCCAESLTASRRSRGSYEGQGRGCRGQSAHDQRHHRGSTRVPVDTPRRQDADAAGQLMKIAKRGRKRYLSLTFVTQSPNDLPDDVLGLVNNWVIYKID